MQQQLQTEKKKTPIKHHKTFHIATHRFKMIQVWKNNSRIFIFATQAHCKYVPVVTFVQNDMQNDNIYKVKYPVSDTKSAFSFI